MHGEVLAALGFDAAHDLADEARAAFEGLGAVIVLALVAIAGHERLADILAGALTSTQSKPQRFRVAAALMVSAMRLLISSAVYPCSRRLEDGRRIGLEAAEHEAHRG